MSSNNNSNEKPKSEDAPQTIYSQFGRDGENVGKHGYGTEVPGGTVEQGNRVGAFYIATLAKGMKSVQTESHVSVEALGGSNEMPTVTIHQTESLNSTGQKDTYDITIDNKKISVSSAIKLNDVESKSSYTITDPAMVSLLRDTYLKAFDAKRNNEGVTVYSTAEPTMKELAWLTDEIVKDARIQEVAHQPQLSDQQTPAIRDAAKKVPQAGASK